MTAGSRDGLRQRRPVYARLLRLRSLRLRGWQRAVLGEGSVALAGVLVLADLVPVWTLLVLPLLVAALVKVHDVVASLLPGTPTAPVPQDRRRPGGARD